MICNATFRWHFNMLLPSLVFSFQLGAYSLSLRRVVATCKFTRVEIIGLVLMDNDIKFLIKRSLQRIGNYYTHRLQHTLVKLLLVLIIFPCLHSISCNFMAEVFYCALQSHATTRTFFSCPEVIICKALQQPQITISGSLAHPCKHTTVVLETLYNNSKAACHLLANFHQVIYHQTTSHNKQ